MEKKLTTYLTRLKQKYNYNDKLIYALRKIIPALIQLYGVDKSNLIFDAIYNCEIKFRDKNEDRSQNSAACYGKELILEDDKITEINEIYVYTTNFDENTIFMNLTHEICHLIKGYNQSYKQGNKIITKIGLVKQNYVITENNIEFIKNENVEIEEAINCHDTSQVLSIIYGKPTVDESYNAACDSIEKLILDNKIFQTIRISQFNNNDTFYELIGKENYQLIDTYLQKINYFCLLRFRKDISGVDREAAEMAVMKVIIEANEAKSKIESLCAELVKNVTSNKKIVYVKTKKQH